MEQVGPAKCHPENQPANHKQQQDDDRDSHQCENPTTAVLVSLSFRIPLKRPTASAIPFVFTIPAVNKRSGLSDLVREGH
jgi:hypothetical protein